MIWWQRSGAQFQRFGATKTNWIGRSIHCKIQKLSVLVTVISERRQVVLFMDGLTEPLKGWVKGFNPATLSEIINKARSMASSSSSRSYSCSKSPTFPRDKPSLDEATRQELRRKKLCFNCKGPWEPSH